MSRRVATPKGMKLRADKLFSQIVRARGACECCGSTQYIQCAHIMSRRFAHTRCDEDNAYALCAKCHHFFTDHPVDFGAYVLTRMTEAEYHDLFQRAHTSTSAVVWVDVVQRLKLRAQELELA